MKTCECQAVNPDDSNFCASCGRPLPGVNKVETAPSRNQSDERVASVSANARRQQRIPVIVGSFIAIALVLAGGLTFLLRNVHIDIRSNNLVSVQLPLNICQTSVGDSSATSANLPANVRVDIAKGFSTNLAFYTDNEGLTEVLAPTGWSCTAAIGADGSSSVKVAPAGQSNVTGAALTPGSTVEEITASQTSACVGCRESLACPLFVSAANDYLSGYQQSCPTTRPKSEHVTKINDDVVKFTDPPGVNGDASPSGGAYPAMGVMTYFDDIKSDGSWTETCLLPAAQKATCKVIIANFVTRYGTR